MEMLYKSRINPPLVRLEQNKGERLTESAGYIPAQKKIEQMIYAGQALIKSRKDQFHYGADDDDDGFSVDPTTSLALDELTALDLKRSYEKKIKDNRKNRVIETKEAPSDDGNKKDDLVENH